MTSPNKKPRPPAAHRGASNGSHSNATNSSVRDPGDGVATDERRHYTRDDARRLVERLIAAIPTRDIDIIVAGSPRPVDVTPTPCWACATSPDLDREPCPRHGATP